ncbi:GGDEF domain-containing protein [Umezawaea beigongshangensis]|uniref:GGDEF domain-containing protein n=1 Tax=Umezawaea beigongshangensis TaxID=2780383 RepID=UPI0027DE0495|nr:GGDEF domain-containing protein [Umezawaea beigongshangensis]
MNTTTAVILAATSTTGWITTSTIAAALWKQLHTDPLTGLPNRAVLDLLARRTRRRHGRVGLLLLDLDRFKSINDTHGHRTGDDVLRAVAHRLTTTTRPGEVPIRLHGDEFALWLGRTTSSAAARDRAAEIARALAFHLVQRHDGRVLAVSASVGAHTVPAARFDLSTLLAGADAAMYAAKHAHHVSTLPTPAAPRRRATGTENATESA